MAVSINPGAQRTVEAPVIASNGVPRTRAIRLVDVGSAFLPTWHPMSLSVTGHLLVAIHRDDRLAGRLGNRKGLRVGEHHHERVRTDPL